MTLTPEQIAKPKELLDAVGELAMAIKPHSMYVRQRKRIAEALHVLVDHIIAYKEDTHPPMTDDAMIEKIADALYTADRQPDDPDFARIAHTMQDGFKRLALAAIRAVMEWQGEAKPPIEGFNVSEPRNIPGLAVALKRALTEQPQ